MSWRCPATPTPLHDSGRLVAELRGWGRPTLHTQVLGPSAIGRAIKRDVRHRRREAARNASKTRSGTRAGLPAPGRERWKRPQEDAGSPPGGRCRRRRQRTVGPGSAATGPPAGRRQKYREWLTAHPQDRTGPGERCGSPTKPTTSRPRWPPPRASSRGYTGVAAVDGRAQVIVEAQAHGTGSEQELLWPVVKATGSLRTPATHHRRCRLSQRGQPESLGRGRDPCPHRRSRHASAGRTLQPTRIATRQSPIPPPQGQGKQETRRFRPADFD